MSALGHKRTFRHGLKSNFVRFTPNSGHLGGEVDLSAKCQKMG